MVGLQTGGRWGAVIRLHRRDVASSHLQLPAGERVPGSAGRLPRGCGLADDQADGLVGRRSAPDDRCPTVYGPASLSMTSAVPGGRGTKRYTPRLRLAGAANVTLRR